MKIIVNNFHHIIILTAVMPSPIYACPITRSNLDGAGKASQGECGFGEVASDHSSWRMAAAEVKRAEEE
jgi:hypothetical protein